MDKKDNAQFVLLMGEMAVAFGVDLPTETLMVYFNRLEPYSMYQVKRAIDETIEYGERFPVLSKLMALAGSFRREPSVVIPEDRQLEEVTVDSDAPRTPEECIAKVNEMLKGIREDV